MTIKRSLILSHVSMCILPFLMTFFCTRVFFFRTVPVCEERESCDGGEWFPVSGHEPGGQGLIFHHIRHSKEALEDHWVLDILDPIQSYVVLYRDGEVTLQYGNDVYQQMVEDLKQQKVQQELDEGEINGPTARRGWGSILLWSVTGSPGMCTISTCCRTSR